MHPIPAAHASCYHWLQAGTWLLAHVYAELGVGEGALWHARRCHELTEAHSELVEDF